MLRVERHTNDAPDAAPRLLDIGIERYLLGSSVKAALASAMCTFRVNGWERTCQGIAIIDEVLRVAQDDRDTTEPQHKARPVGIVGCVETLEN